MDGATRPPAVLSPRAEVWLRRLDLQAFKVIEALLGGDGWRPVAGPLVAPLLAECRTLEDFRDRLPELLTEAPDPQLIETLGRLLASARLAGLAGGALEPGGVPEPGRAGGRG